MILGDVERAHTAPTSPMASSTPFPSAILLAFFSLLLVLLVLPSATWHIRNRNIGASSLVVMILISNFSSFINALIWPADNHEDWYSGTGLCDLEVKLQVASHVLIPGAATCMLRALARVMDTERTSMGLSKAQKRRDLAFEMTFCLALPLLEMLAHYIVQPSRYYIYGIAGCVPTVDSSWPTLILVLLPPVLLTLLDAYYAILIIYRLRKYRRAFTSIMACNNMTKSRFTRLFLICLVVIFASIPAQAYVFYTVLQWKWVSYSWSAIHDAEAWKEIVMVPSEGTIFYDRYIWLAEGVTVFLLFGVGKDAFRTYKNGLVWLGLGKVFPALKPGYRSPPKTPSNSMLASVSSKARSFLKRRTVVSTWFGSKGSQSTSYTDSSVGDPPKKMSFLDVLDSPTRQKPRPGPQDIEANGVLPTRKPSTWSRLLRFGSGNGLQRRDSETVALGSIMTNQTVTVSSESKVGEISPAYALGHDRGRSKDEIYVKREFRLGSETAEVGKPVRMYEGV